MNNSHRASPLWATRKRRLWLAGIGVVVCLFLSGITAYYWHTTAPLIPLLTTLLLAIPAGIIVDEVRKSPRAKKTQKTGYPPKRSSQ